MHRYSILTDGQSLDAADPETVLQVVTGATRRLRHCAFKLAFKSVAASDAPVLVELVEQTSAGTSAAATLRALDRADPAAISTAFKNFTAEPTDSGVVLDRFRVTPVGGLAIYHIPEDDQIVQAVSTRVGYRLTADQAQSGVEFTAIIQE